MLSTAPSRAGGLTPPSPGLLNYFFLVAPMLSEGCLAGSHRARVQRGESATARCASTGNRQTFFLFFLLPILLLPGIGGGRPDSP
jgi:hypothetical protein